MDPRGSLPTIGETRPVFERVFSEKQLALEGLYDVTLDGKRFAVIQSVEGDSAGADTSHVVLAFDWTDELRRMFER